MDKKKLWLLLGAAALVLLTVLVAVLHKPKAEKEMEKLPGIGLCLCQYEADPEYGQLLEKTFREAGYRVTVLDAKNDQSRQTEQINRLLKEEPALLVIEPVITDAVQDTVTLLTEKNIPAVFIGDKPVLQQWSKACYVASAQDRLGQLQGQILLQTANRGDLNEDGQVSCLVLTGPEDDVAAKAQAEGCINALISEGVSVDQLETSWGDWTTDSGQLRCTKALSQYGKDIEVIFCGNEQITLGALEAVKTSGWQLGTDYCLIGAGAAEKLQPEHMTGTVAYDWENLAQQVLSAAQSLINGDAVEREYYVNYRTVTEETE